MSILNLSLLYGSYVGVFHSLFHTSLRLHNLITPEEKPRPLVTHVLCQGSIGYLSTYLWLRHVISYCSTYVDENLGKLFRVTTQQYAPSSRNVLIEDTGTSVFPVVCRNSILQPLHDEHSFSLARFLCTGSIQDSSTQSSKVDAA